MSSVRRHLTEDQYLLVSSFYENILASRAQPWDVVDHGRLVFVFGHYVNESLLPLLRPKSLWDVFLFTGVRNPVSRAISQYYQITKITERNLEIESFISKYGSSMCDEIMRAFPSFANPDKPRWLNAAEALTSFDYIYSTENYSQSISPVYESIGLSPPSFEALENRDNVRVAPVDSAIASAIESAMQTSDDTRLYSLIEPVIGQINAGKLVADLIHTDRKRAKLLEKACSASGNRCTDMDLDFLYNMMGHELHLLGDDKKAEVLGIMQKKRDRADEIIKFLQERTY